MESGALGRDGPRAVARGSVFKRVAGANRVWTEQAH
jgi:hypothetical protein